MSNSTLIEVTEETRLKWFGNLKRMGSNTIPQIILWWNVDAGREEIRKKKNMISKALTEEDESTYRRI